MDLDIEFEKHRDSLMNVNLENYHFKSMFTSIPDDVDKLVKETSNDNYVRPRIVIITIANLENDNPCGVCAEAVEQLKQWALDSSYVSNGQVKLIIATEFDDKKIWHKLGANLSEAPRHYIFDTNYLLFDVVDGVMNGSYIETFYGKLIK